MQTTQYEVEDAAVRVRRLLDANDAALGTVNQSGARQALDRAMAEVAAHGVVQGTRKIGARGETANQRVIRIELRRVHMRPIATIAQAKLHDVPQFTDLRLPGGNVRGTRLVSAARSMAAAATAYAPVLVEAGLKPDFLQALNDVANRLEASLNERVDHHRVRQGATVGIDAATAHVRKAIRMLDALVEQQTANVPELLAEWKAAKRYRRKPGVSRSSIAPIAMVTPAAAAGGAAAT
jgi:hypothetical protein